MKKIGFLTSIEDPDLISDDRLAFPFLEKNGFFAQPVIWDHFDQSEMASFDGFVFRSCWNYHRKFSQFLQFLEQLENLKVPVYNSLDAIRWNLNKKHILDFAKKIPVPKTYFFQAGETLSSQNLRELSQEWGVDSLVIKPAVSLNGQDTYLVQGLKDLQKMEGIISKLLKNRDLLVQEFIPEIKTSGEISLIYFNRQFSHAIRKIPAKNEFRVHTEYGGSRDLISASEVALEYGQSILSQTPGKLLYSRVDIVESNRGPLLIEVEATDPMLHLGMKDQAAKRFADAIIEVFR